MKTGKLLRFCIGFTVLGLAHWFFGNLYEMVVFTPNTLADPASALTSWNTFTRVTNPVWYFIPMCPLTLLASAAAYFIGRQSHSSLQRWLRLTFILTGVAALLTVYIVTQINLKVFFSGMDLQAHREHVNQLIWRGLPFSLSRVVVDGAGLYTAIRAYLTSLTPISQPIS